MVLIQQPSQNRLKQIFLQFPASLPDDWPEGITVEDLEDNAIFKAL